MPNFRNYRFWGSVRSKKELPKDGLPEVVIVGRSNVGKSSLLNTLLGSRKAAQVSKNPGKTRILNFFKVDDKFYLVDLPGYGYANRSRGEKESWKQMVEEYFLNSKNIKSAILIVDGRHTTFTSDVEMKKWFDHLNIPVILVATKADKLSKPKLLKLWRNNIEDLYESDSKMPLFFSAVSGQGRNELIKQIECRIS